VSYRRGLQEDCFSRAVAVGDIPDDAKTALWVFGAIAVLGLVVVTRPKHHAPPMPRSINFASHHGHNRDSRRYMGSGLLG